MSSLAELFERSQQLRYSQQSTASAPSDNDERIFEQNGIVGRSNIFQVLSEGEQLWKQTSHNAGRELEPTVSGIGDAASVQQDSSTAPGDLASLLQMERELALSRLLEQTVFDSVTKVEEKQWATRKAEWQNQKRRLFAAIPHVDFQSLPKQSKSTQFGITSADQAAVNHNVVQAAQRTATLIESELQQNNLNCNDNFVNDMLTDADTVENREAWQMTKFLLSETGLPGDEQSLSSLCNNNTVQNKSLIEIRNSLQFHSSLASKSLRYLEHNYCVFVDSIVKRHLRQAELGGEPDDIKLIGAFLSLQPLSSTGMFEDGTVEGQPVWGVMMHALRMGKIDTVERICLIAKASLPSHILHAVTELKTNGRISSDTDTVLKLQYRRTVKGSSDPYKRAVYSIIAGVDCAEDHLTVVGSTLEDWLWLKLHHVRSTIVQGSQSHADSLSMAQLHKIIVQDYGEKHFTSSGRPTDAYVYFNCLWLTGQCERAVEFLNRQSQPSYRVQAVHLALALFNVNLIMTSSSTQAALVVSERNDPPLTVRLNLARLVLMYVAVHFRESNPQYALYYYFFLRNFKTPLGDNLFNACVNELVSASKEYELLLGILQSDGRRMSGLLDRFQSIVDVNNVIKYCAEQAKRQGNYERAVKLFDLCGADDKSIDLLCTLLSQSHSLQNEEIDRRIKLAQDIASRYRDIGCKANAELSPRLYLLLDIQTFFKLVRDQKFGTAIQVLRQLKMLPFDMKDVESNVNGFSLLHQQVQRLVPDLLLSAMCAFLGEVNSWKARSKTSNLTYSLDQRAENVTVLSTIKNAADSILHYAGSIPLRMADDTYARLHQYKSQINN